MSPHILMHTHTHTHMHMHMHTPSHTHSYHHTHTHTRMHTHVHINTHTRTQTYTHVHTHTHTHTRTHAHTHTHNTHATITPSLPPLQATPFVHHTREPVSDAVLGQAHRWCAPQPRHCQQHETGARPLPPKVGTGSGKDTMGQTSPHLNGSAA